METIILVLAIALVIGINELRDWRIGKRHKELGVGIESTFVVLSDLERRIKEIKQDLVVASEALKKQAKDNDEFKSFISEAHVDLKTIVNEYEVNGVPLGFDRTGGQKFDMVEGI